MRPETPAKRSRHTPAGTAVAGHAQQHVPRSDEEHRFSDELGFFWEDAGGTRMAGRVLGALLIADPPGLSSSELAEFLAASAGSISTATRELIRPGLAERVHVPGNRQGYFRATMGANVPQFLRSRIESTRRYGQLMQRGEALTASKDPAVRRQLQEIREFFEFLETEQLGILERWEHRHRKGEARAWPGE